MKMQNKVVVVTGASTGIGYACAEAFGMAGAQIVLAARSADTLQTACLKLKQKNISCIAVPTDVSVETDCQNLISKAIEAYGKIDILVNNAGISMRSLFIDVDLNVLKKLMDVNFWGTVYCTKHALPYLLKSQGSLLGISSVSGKKGVPARTGYSASKFAMEGLLESIRIENLHNGLHVLVVSPGFIATGIRQSSLTSDGTSQKDSPRNEAAMMTPETAASAIVQATSKRKRDLVLTSQGKLLVFLDKFIPAIMDKIVYKHMAKEANSPFK
jgi:dehydrogenase/reductase SDR family protein 7B